MQTITAWIKRHPVLAYYLLVFAISWLGMIAALGPGGFLGTSATPETQLMVGGPIGILGPSIGSILMTGLLYGRAGLRELLARLLKWRVGAVWYAFALLTAPVLKGLSLLLLSHTPVIVTATDKAAMLLTAIAFGFVAPFFEELGWTGFATPELRKRFGVLATGLIIGVLWGLWHAPLFSASARVSISPPPALFMAILLFSWLIPYRVLMVWLYEHTKSLLLNMLMHVPIVVISFIFALPAPTSAQIAVGNVVFTVLLWITVAAVFLLSRGKLEARSLSEDRAS